MFFTRKISIEGFNAPNIFGKEIELSNAVKVLGMDLVPYLNYLNYQTNDLIHWRDLMA